ncbi:MAG: Rne/Rng family ribonuclease [Actinobacteria bacterium]|nr:Rne/Rng family ribonuclease [Actinomycetota bacterium]
MDDRTPSSESTGATPGASASSADNSSSPSSPPNGGANRRRRRGSRGGQGRQRSASPASDGATGDSSVASSGSDAPRAPRIGDTMPIPTVPPPGPARTSDEPPAGSGAGGGQSKSARNRRRRSRGGGGGSSGGAGQQRQGDKAGPSASRRRQRGGQSQELSPETLERRRGRERDGKPLGRYVMCVQVRDGITQVGVLEGRNLIEHYVSRPADDVAQIHGNIYLGRVQNVLPGMEAAFVDIATPKNAVLYRGDVQFDPDDVDSGGEARIEEILKNKQMILCQVTKNPIGAKGARLTQEVSLPGRFVVLIPNSSTYGISKRLPDDVRRRLRSILDRVKPDQHGLIVRTAAEHATEAELSADMELLLAEWARIEARASEAKRPALLHREPELAVRVIREEFNADYRRVVIDDERLYNDIREYVGAFNPELVDRIEFYNRATEQLSLFEEYHIHEQVHKALDRKVWLPSGGSLIIEHTEALTVIDVNTGKNVGKDNLEATVFANNLEAATEIAHQLRLRDIGGIIVIDFIDMEIKQNRAAVVDAFREALSRDKTRTQVFDISELGLVEMTRKRIGEGLLTEFSTECPDCAGRGLIVDHGLLN